MIKHGLGSKTVDEDRGSVFPALLVSVPLSLLCVFSSHYHHVIPKATCSSNLSWWMQKTEAGTGLEKLPVNTRRWLLPSCSEARLDFSTRHKALISALPS